MLKIVAFDGAAVGDNAAKKDNASVVDNILAFDDTFTIVFVVLQ